MGEGQLLGVGVMSTRGPKSSKVLSQSEFLEVRGVIEVLNVI